MISLYVPILKSHNTKDYDPTGLLLRCLENVVYHSKNLKMEFNRNTTHVFTRIYILKNMNLMKDLSKLVTVSPTPYVMENPTGIPSHLRIFKMLSDVMDLNGKIFNELFSQQQKLKDIISKTIDDK